MDKWVADEAGTEVSMLPIGQLACVSTVPVRVSPELDHTLVPLRETWAKVPFPEFQGFLVEPELYEAVGHCTGQLWITSLSCRRVETPGISSPKWLKWKR